MSSRKLRAVRILLVVLAIPIVGSFVAYLWINRVADRRWAEASDRMHQLAAAHPEGDARRDPESVTEASKENQIHFVAAIRLAAPRQSRRVEALELVQDKKRGAALDAVIDEVQDVLDRLHEGARRIAASPSEFPPRWHGDWDQSTLSYILSCGVLRARRQRERNASFDAAETLLDALQLARFWAISGAKENRGQALSSLPWTLEELRDLLVSSTLSAEQLLRVERELEPLDDAMQSPLRDLEPILARWGENLRKVDLGEEGLPTDAGLLWKYVLPQRLMKAEAFQFGDRQVRLLLANEPQGYPELLRIGDQAENEADRSGNPLLRRIGNLVKYLGWHELERKAQLRLLRVAAHYGATGQILDVQDPFGTVLRHAPTPTGMKFWSVGDDGKDDGGLAGGGKGWRYPADPDARDVVLEVPRRR